MTNNEVGVPKIYITDLAKNKLDMYIHIAPNEISGIGIVDQIDTDAFLVEDVFIFTQESSAAATDFSGEDYALGVVELLGKDIPSEKMRVWWHSHASMSSFFSTTDKDTMNKNPTFTDIDWFISIVGNKKGDYNIRFDQHKPVRFYIDGLSFQDMGGPVICEAAGCTNAPEMEGTKRYSYCVNHNVIYADLKSEFDEKVSAPKVTTVYVHGGRDGHWGGANRGKETETKGKDDVLGKASVSLNGETFITEDADEWFERYKRDEEESKQAGLNDTNSHYCQHYACYRRVKNDEQFCPRHEDVDVSNLLGSEFDAIGDFTLCLVHGCTFTVADNVSKDDLELTFCDYHLSFIDPLVKKYGKSITDDLTTLAEVIDYIDDNLMMDLGDPSDDYVDYDELVKEIDDVLKEVSTTVQVDDETLGEISVGEIAETAPSVPAVNITKTEPVKELTTGKKKKGGKA